MAPQSRPRKPRRKNEPKAPKQALVRFAENRTPTNNPKGRLQSKTKDQRWNKLQRMVRILYDVYSRDETQQRMKKHFGFEASYAIYTKMFKEWGLRKQITKQEYNAMWNYYEIDSQGERPRFTTDSEFYILGMSVSLEKVKRERDGPRYGEPIAAQSDVPPSSFVVQKRIDYTALPWFKFIGSLSIREADDGSLLHPSKVHFLERLATQEIRAFTTHYQHDRRLSEDDKLELFLSVISNPGSEADHDTRARIVPEVYDNICAVTLGARGNFLDLILNFSSQSITQEQLLFALKFVIYLSSNNLLPEFIADRFVNVFLSRAQRHILEMVCFSDIPTCRAFAEEVLRSALRRKDHLVVRSLIRNRIVSSVLGYYEFGSLLWYAAYSGSMENVKTLIQYGADLNYANPESPLQAAARRGHLEIVKTLLELGAEVDIAGSYPDEDGSTPLQLAAKAKHIDVVKLLLDSGADVNAESGWHQDSEIDWYLGKSDLEIEIGGGTALRAAVFFHPDATIRSEDWFVAEEIVKLLLERKADVQDEPEPLAKEDAPKTALQAAAFHGMENVVKMLISMGADVNAAAYTHHADDDFNEYPDTMTALQAASASGNITIVQTLIDNGALVNAPVVWRTALQAACEYGHKEIVRLLLDNDADVHEPVPPPSVETALTLVLSPLLHEEGDFDNGKTHRSLTDDEYEIAKMLSQEGADVDHLLVVTAVGRDTSGRLLELLTNESPEQRQSYLLRHSNSLLAGAASAGFGKTHGPNGRPNIEYVRFLLEQGARLDTTRPDAAQPLLCAILSEDYNLIELFISLGTDIRMESGSQGGLSRIMPTTEATNTTFLEAAVRTEKGKLVQHLIDLGALVNPKHGAPPLQVATHRRNTKLMKILLEAGADPNAPPKYAPFTALQQACRFGDVSAVRLLLSCETIDLNKIPEAQPGHPPPSKVTPLREAIGRNHLEIVNALLEKGAQLIDNQIGAGGPVLRRYVTPHELFRFEPVSNAQEAARAGNLEILQTLLQRDPSIVEGDGKIIRFALISKIADKRYEVVDLLVRHKASINGDSEGVPLVDACEEGNIRIAQLLLDCCADVNLPSKLKKGETALQAACMGGFLGVVKLLLSRGADINAFGHRTALERAAEYGRLDIVDLLLRSGASTLVERTYYIKKDGVRVKETGNQFDSALRISKTKGFRQVSKLIQEKLDGVESMSTEQELIIDLGSLDLSPPETEVCQVLSQEAAELLELQTQEHLSLSSEPTVAPTGTPPVLEDPITEPNFSDFIHDLDGSNEDNSHDQSNIHEYPPLYASSTSPFPTINQKIVQTPRAIYPLVETDQILSSSSTEDTNPLFPNHGSTTVDYAQNYIIPIPIPNFPGLDNSSHDFDFETSQMQDASLLVLPEAESNSDLMDISVLGEIDPTQLNTIIFDSVIPLQHIDFQSLLHANDNLDGVPVGTGMDFQALRFVPVPEETVGQSGHEFEPMSMDWLEGSMDIPDLNEICHEPLEQ